MAEMYAEHALCVLGRYAAREAEQALSPLNIRETEYDVMEVISKYMENPDIPELRVSNIAKRAGFTRPTTYNHTGRLQRSLYVRETPGGGRLLTAAGVEKLEECRYALRHINRRLSKLLTDRGLEEVARALTQYQEAEGSL